MDAANSNPYVEGFVDLLKKVAQHQDLSKTLKLQYWESLSLTEIIGPEQPDTYQHITNQRPYLDDAYFWSLDEIRTAYEDFLVILENHIDQLPKEKAEIDKARSKFDSASATDKIINIDDAFKNWKQNKGQRLSFEVILESNKLQGIENKSDYFNVKMKLELVSAKFRINRPWFSSDLLKMRSKDPVKNMAAPLFDPINGGLYLIPQELLIGWRPKLTVTRYTRTGHGESKIILNPADNDLAKPILLAVSSKIFEL